MDKSEFLYMVLVLGAFGTFMLAMIVASLQDRAWARKIEKRRD